MNKHYKFTLEPLPYNYNSLEPYIDELTLHLHHDKHLQNYINNLNSILENYPEYQNWSLQELVKNYNLLPISIKNSVKNNAGGVYNHEFYFSCMTPNFKEISPTSKLFFKINSDFGNLEHFKTQFKAIALSTFGSEYVWLVFNNSKLEIIKTVNQDTPLILNLHPIICLDLWEHAYYIKYYNNKENYINNWFNILNWKKSEENFINILYKNFK